LQDRIAMRTLAAIEPRVQAIEAAKVSEHPTESLDAYHCVLKAISLLYQFTPETFGIAGELLERAILLDPTYAQAYAYRAWWLNFQIGEGRSTNVEEDRALAIVASRKAMELDRDDPFVLAVAGHVCSLIGRNPEEAIELFDEALALNPNSAFAWGVSALTLCYLGRPDEALERLENVWRLNPFDTLNFYFWIVAGIAEFSAGRYDQSVAWLRKCRRASPRFAANLRTLAAALALSGDEVGAKSIGQEFLKVEPTFRVSSFLSWYPLRRADDLSRLGSGLRMAGLPD
jgi:tetratricopeptide (TPR) repeat protein